MGFVNDEAFLLEPRERLPDRPPADVQHAGQFVLDEPRARREASV